MNDVYPRNTSQYTREIGQYWDSLSDEEKKILLGLTTSANDNYKINFGAGTSEGNSSATWFDTGGYTGDWNSSDGRMAVLHEKELVLNKTDTQNILNAVDVARQLNSAIFNRLSSFEAHNGSSNVLRSIANEGAPIEQNVHITAEFPNVSVKAEIEEAFTELVNVAVQYVNVKK